MSSETNEWLNQRTLIGNVDQRGKAWHYRADQQGAEPNHYPGFIPLADIKRRLFVICQQLFPDGVGTFA